MILALLALRQADQPQVQSFLGNAGSPVVTAIAVNLPANVSYATAELLGHVLERSNQAYSASDLEADKAQVFPSAGKLVAVFQTPAGAVEANIGLAISLLTQPHLDDETVQSYMGKPGPYWLEARVGSSTHLTEAPLANDLWALWARSSRPANVTIISKGDLGQADYATEFSKENVQWPAQPLHDWRFDLPLKLAHPLLPPDVEAVQWRARPLSPLVDDLGLAVLAAEAMGQGNTSVVTRVSRFQNGWSYDQETVLMPEASGYVPVTTIFRRSTLEGRPVPEVMAKALNDGIEQMTDAQLLHYKKLAVRALKGGLEHNPLLISPDRPFSSSTESRVEWSAIWGPQAALPDSFVKGVSNASLDEVKKACHLMISGDAVVLTRE